MAWLTEWFSTLEWHRVIPEMLGHALGLLIGFGASWYFLFRRKLRDIERFQQGDSDDILFQMHLLKPIADAPEDVALLFRNVGPRTTVNLLYDNPAAREEIKKDAEKTTLSDPILATTGRAGFEVLNDAFGHFAGTVALSTFPRERWLFTMTCEDRQAVRKQCIRCFVIRPEDLARFSDWGWCSKHVRVEHPSHWFRVVALHQIAKVWESEKSQSEEFDTQGMRLIDDHAKHRRVRQMSIGLNHDDKPVTEPHIIPWAKHVSMLKDLGLHLSFDEPKSEPS